MKRDKTSKLGLATTLAFCYFFLMSSLVAAHPGSVNSSGCHYCRTNCAQYGLDDDEYHCHDILPSKDCAGVSGGTAYYDNCNRCVGGTTGKTACTKDCAGIYGGLAYYDNCNRCVGGTTGKTACTKDCAGVYGGNAYQDDCGDCVGGNTGKSPCNSGTTDCAGVPGGTAYYDDCGKCVEGTTGESPCGENPNPFWITMKGTVYNGDAIKLCAMVLANGQYMFSCAGDGKYRLAVPLDDNGEITLFAFCDGLSPFKHVFAPQSLADINYDINMLPGDSGSKSLTLNPTQSIASKQGWSKLSGKVESDGIPLCAMVLANGQYMFSCSGDGTYELEVPFDTNGEITLFGFCDGFLPFKVLLNQSLVTLSDQ